MYENLMEEVVAEENCRLALQAVARNKGAAGIDRMKTTELESHLQANWEKIRAKLLNGTYVPSPVRRVEIPKPSGGTRMLGIPTVQDRFIQQLLLQVLTPIFDPTFSEHSYGFRPGRSAGPEAKSNGLLVCDKSAEAQLCSGYGGFGRQFESELVGGGFQAANPAFSILLFVGLGTLIDIRLSPS
jgi:hypothetical protein